MLARILLAWALLAAAAGVAAAQTAKPQAAFTPIDYPIEVRKALSSAVVECRQGDGGKVTFDPDTVRRIDLTGDGRDDFIVSFRDTECSSYPFLYCGSGGCSLQIFVALADGRYRKVFSKNVRGYEILPGKRARTIRFSMHGAYCDDFGPAECNKQRRITDKPFTWN